MRALHLVLLAVICACSKPAPSEKPAEADSAYQGREETRALQNADNIGYDGTGIQKKLDVALDKNDQRADELNKQIDAQTGGGDIHDPPQP